MGQRHQLFVIARINGRYRTLCAVHHQWLYGHTALKRCLGTIKILQDPSNRLPLQQELLIAKAREEALWPSVELENESYDVHIEFPFIATCLTLGASFGLDGYHHGVSIEPFHMYFDEGDNNNGITIFDITDLEHVRYCFVDFMGMESERKVQLMAPLSGRTYLEAYYALDELDEKTKEEMLSTIKALEDYPLITTATLRNTWPTGDWQEPEADVTLVQSSDPDSLDEITDKFGTVSLRDKSMESLLQSLVNPSNSDLVLLSELEIMPDFLPKLKQKLYDEAPTFEASQNLHMVLVKALEKDVDVDLRPFTSLSVHDLSTIVATLRKYGTMAGLNLSNRPDLTERDLETILGLDQACKRLYLLANPQISGQYLTSRLGKYELFHSELLSRALIEDDVPRFTDCPDRQRYDFSCSNDLSQIVWVGIPKDMAVNPRPFDFGKLKATEASMTLYSFSKDLEYQQCLTNDIPVSAGKVVKGLLRLLQWAVSCDNGMSLTSSLSSGIGCALATSPSAAASDDAVSVLSTSLYMYPRRNDRSSRRSKTTAPSLKMGQWAVFVVHEAYDAFITRPKEDDDDATKRAREAKRTLKKLRYALVTPVDVNPAGVPSPSQKRFHIVDVPTYIKRVLEDERSLKEVEELTKLWNQRFAAIDSDFYGEADIFDILDKVYPQDDGAQEANKSTADEDSSE
ncbi:MAG: hypothetical protein Q9166_000647 [cf. Caloplaca sp. 2 TL-2023]